MMTQSMQQTPDPQPFCGQLLIDGQWCAAADGAILERHSPANGELVARHALAGVADTQRAVASARRAFDSGPWPQMSGAARARLLHAAADAIAARRQELARMESLENGKPLTQALAEIDSAADLWQYAAGLARELHGDSYNQLGADTLGLVLREPIGVVALITPWNFPFLIVSQKLPFALAAGCTVVVKPSELTSATTLILGQILVCAGIPPGVVNILVGTGAVVGQALVTHPDVDMLSFTGSTAVGKQAAASAAETVKKVALELGGKNPQIVFADCDLDAAVDAAVHGIFFNAGQCCNSGSRILVQQSIAQEFSAAVVERARRVRVGDPFDAATQVGAITSAKQLEAILAHLDAARKDGAQFALGGARMQRPGMYVEPTVLTGVRPEMAIARQEVFGPVLAILTFDTPDAAVALANATLYGLSAAVWSTNLTTCLSVARRIRAGTVWVNGFLEGHAELPFGGYRESGMGRELGRHAALDYTQSKTLHLHLGARSQWYLPKDSKD